MKNQNIIVAAIIGVALVVSASILAGGLRSLGQSVGISIGSAGAAPQPRMPTEFKVRMDDINIRASISNGGGPGESFRVQSLKQ